MYHVQIGCLFSFWDMLLCMVYFSALLAVTCTECSDLLPAVVALSVALVIVVVLMVVAIFTTILFYSRESLHRTSYIE